MSHTRLDNIVKLDYKLICKSDMFVGSGHEFLKGNPEDLVDLDTKMNARQRKMVMDSKEFLPVKHPNYYINGDDTIYFVPGSTIKGLSRSRMEINSSKKVCFLIKDDHVNPQAKKHRELFELTRDRYPKNHSCWICQLYGSPKTGKSKIEFSDAILKSGDVKLINFTDHGNEFVQIFEKGSVFRGNITMKNLSLREQALVVISLGMIKNHGRLMGYSKYRIKEDNNKTPIELGSVKFKIRKFQRYEPNAFGRLEKVIPDLSGLKGDTAIRREYKKAIIKYKKDLKKIKLSDTVDSFDEIDIIDRSKPNDKKS